MAMVTMGENAWLLFSQSLYDCLSGRLKKNSGDYIKRVTVENGAITITKGDGSTVTANTVKMYNSLGDNTDGTMTQAAIKASISAKEGSVYRAMGTVPYYGSLPTANNSPGDVYNIKNGNKAANILPGDNVVWVARKTHVDEGYERAAGTYDPNVTYYVDSSTGREIDTSELVTDYVPATGNFVGGTTYYTDETGETKVDTSEFSDGETDVSGYYVSYRHDKFQEGVTDMSGYFVHYSNEIVDQEEGWDKLAGNYVPPAADSATAGVMKLMQETGADTTSTMSQAAITAALSNVWTKDILWVDEDSGEVVEVDTESSGSTTSTENPE